MNTVFGDMHLINVDGGLDRVGVVYGLRTR